MADVAKRLTGPALITNSGTTVYTVPASTTTTVRNIHACYTGSSTSVTFTLGINGVTTALSLYYQFALPERGTLDWSGFLVLNAGDTVQALASTTNVVSLTISGVETS
jgi:hypothetical protein